MRAVLPLVLGAIVGCAGSQADDSNADGDSGSENGGGSGAPVRGGSGGQATGGAGGKSTPGGGSAGGGRDGGGRDGGSGGRAGEAAASGGAAGESSGSGGSSGAGMAGGNGVPNTDCIRLEPVARDAPDHTVGDGTAASCTEEALRAAASDGGHITFDCGAEPFTLTLEATLVISKETVLDGGGLVTLSGGGNVRILYFDSAYDLTTPRLTVQRLGFRDGNSPEGGEDTAVGGGAIYRDGGSLTVIDCDFQDNRAPATGQDVAGGAIYGFGGGEIVISGSSFRGNSASDGGAVGSLNGDLSVIDSTFSNNAATGTDGNPGNGGCGGAIYMDGGDEATTLCGVVIENNTAGAIGGGFFRVSNSDDGSFSMTDSVVRDNRVTPEADGNAGGLYLQGLAIEISASTVSRNRAFYNGGLWISEATANLTNVTIAENTAFGSNGGGLWLAHEPTGLLLNCTIARNHSTAANQIAGAIFGAGLTLKNTIVAGNTAMYTPGCNETHASAGGNLQWPDGALCTEAPTVSNPELGELANDGGWTETLSPAAWSPAVGLGRECPPMDQRGQRRAEPCTAGAVELSPK
jgi:hypothetical protein